MKIREQAIEELWNLNPTEILKIYDHILSLKGRSVKKESRTTCTAYLRARKALKNCSGSLAEDILTDREERI